MDNPVLPLPGRRSRCGGSPGAVLRRIACTVVTAAATAAAIAQVSITPATLPPATTGVAYSVNLSASGGTAPYVFSNEVGRLPTGLSLTPAGLLAGTPLPATVPFEIWATDVDGREAKLSAGTNLVTSPLVLNATVLPGGTVGVGYGTPLTVGGGTPPYACSLIAGVLPPGVVLNSNCTLSGTPSAPGGFSFTVQVIDQANRVTTASFVIEVVNGVVPMLGSMPLMLLALLLAATAGRAWRRRASIGQ